MIKRRIFSLLTMMSIFACTSAYGGEYPQKYDLREQKRVTKVREQGSIRSHWAIAFMDSLESSSISSNNGEELFSVNNMMTSTSKRYSENYSRVPNGDGNLAVATAYVASWEGPVLQEDDPYAYKGQYYNMKLRTGLSAKKHVQEVLFLPEREDSTDNDLIKDAIMEYGGVAASLRKGKVAEQKDFFHKKNKSWYHPVVKDEDEGEKHTVTLVGWDDEYPKENFMKEPKGDGAFIAKDGKEGYFYISYYDMNLGAKADSDVGMAVVTRIDDTDKYQGIYQHDPLGYTMKYTPEGEASSVFFINTFKVKKMDTLREKLAAVSFYTLEQNLDYEIYMLDGVKSRSYLNKMKLIKKGNMELPGYHTVDLDMKNVLYPGREVAIGIKLISKDGTTPSIALENPDGVILSDARADKGESFVRDSEGGIVDLSEMFNNTNACIKMFTKEIKAQNPGKSQSLFMDMPFQWGEAGIVVDRDSGNFKKGDNILEIAGYDPKGLNKLLREYLDMDDEVKIRYSGGAYVKDSYHGEKLGLMNVDDTVDILVQRGQDQFVLREIYSLEKNEEIKEEKATEDSMWHIEKENNLAYLRGDQQELKDIQEFLKGARYINNLAIDMRSGIEISPEICTQIKEHIEALKGNMKVEVYLITSGKLPKDKDQLIENLKEELGAITIGERMNSKEKIDIVVNMKQEDIIANRDIIMEKLRERTRWEDNCTYSDDSINILEYGELNIKSGKKEGPLKYNQSYKYLYSHFRTDEIEKVYIEDTITHERLDVTRDEDYLYMPLDAEHKTYHLVFKLKNKKQYRILIDILEINKENRGGKLIDVHTNNGLYMRKYYEHKRGLSFRVDQRGYLNLRFEKNLKDKDISKHIVFTNNGKRIGIRMISRISGIDFLKKNLQLKISGNLSPGDGYLLEIPEDTIEFEDGTKYRNRLKFSFEVPKVEGAFSSSFVRGDERYLYIDGNQPFTTEGKEKVILTDSNGKEWKVSIETLHEFNDMLRVKIPDGVDIYKENTLTIPKGYFKFKYSGLNKRTIEHKFKNWKIGEN